jgi:hypothetical protein
MSPGRGRTPVQKNTGKKDSNEKAKIVPTKLNPGHRSRVAFLFDLDGTLIDSVYQHVLAWSEALEKAGIPLSVWRIHRRIGMSRGPFVKALLRETGHEVILKEAARLQQMHAEEAISSQPSQGVIRYQIYEYDL